MRSYSNPISEKLNDILYRVGIDKKLDAGFRSSNLYAEFVIRVRRLFRFLVGGKIGVVLLVGRKIWYSLVVALSKFLFVLVLQDDNT